MRSEWSDETLRRETLFSRERELELVILVSNQITERGFHQIMSDREREGRYGNCSPAPHVRRREISITQGKIEMQSW